MSTRESLTANQITPAPWYVARDDRDGMEWNLHICSVPQPNLTVCFMAHDGDGINEHGEANACLIAAAPDMFALLKELIDIEGPQPGTAEWARKVQECIAHVETPR